MQFPTDPNPGRNLRYACEQVMKKDRPHNAPDVLNQNVYQTVGKPRPHNQQMKQKKNI